MNTTTSKCPWQPWVVTLSSALFFFYTFIQLNMFNALDLALMAAFHVKAAQLGNLSSMYFYGTVIFLFPAGLLLDRFSTRKLLLFVMFLSAFATFVFGASPIYWIAAGARIVVGVAGAFCLLASVRIASRWFPPQKMALAVGLIVTLAMLGGFVAQHPFSLLVKAVGWRKAVYCDAFLGALIWILIFTFVRDYPKGYNIEAEKAEHKGSVAFWKAILRVLKNPQNWLGGLYTSLVNLPIFLIGAMWGSLYLMEVRHLSQGQATWVTGMIFLGTIIGSPVVGWFSDHLGRRKLPMLLGAFLSLIVILAIIYLPNLNYTALLVLFFLLGFITSSQVISYPLIAESNALSVTGTAEGLASVLIMSGGFTMPLFGWLMQLNWNHKVGLNGIAFFSKANFDLGMSIMSIAFVLAIVIAVFVKETYCKPLVQK